MNLTNQNSDNDVAILPILGFIAVKTDSEEFLKLMREMGFEIDEIGTA